MATELLPAATKDAVLSDDGVYRYRLTRQWGPGPAVCWVMLNPSTADADLDDPTIRRCMGFSRSWGWDGIVVVNLFPLRATNPKELLRHQVWPEVANEGHINNAIEDTAFTVAAWGANVPGHGLHVPDYVERAAGWHHKPLRSLGTTKHGHPRHPLYVKSDQPLRIYPEHGGDEMSSE